MEPRIQYTKTSDGVSIAFWAMGEGGALVHLPPMLPFSHIELECQAAEWRRWYERLAQTRRLVRYDSRGMGLSQRGISDYSMEALTADLDAVVERLGEEKVDILAFLHAGPVAIAYAAAHPERVSHLVLWCSHASASEYSRSPRREALHNLIDQDWELFTETIAHTRFGWTNPDDSRRTAAYLRESLTQQEAHAAYNSIHFFDITDVLSRVKAPTMVFHRRELKVADPEVARVLASGISGARLVMLEGASAATYLGDMEVIARTIDEFLGPAGPLQLPAIHMGTGTLPAGLTVREAEILALIAQGKSSREIAVELVLSARTVERHTANIYTKTRVHGRAQATAYALDHGLVRHSSTPAT